MMNSAIGVEIEEQCPQSLPTEKRKHAEVGDGSPQSKPIPPEKRNCVEIVEQPPESLPPIGEQKVCKCKCQAKGEYDGPTFEELPPEAQKFLQRFRDKFGPKWPKTVMGSHHRSNGRIGDISILFADEEQKENSQGKY